MLIEEVDSHDTQYSRMEVAKLEEKAIAIADKRVKEDQRKKSCIECYTGISKDKMGQAGTQQV